MKKQSRKNRKTRGGYKEVNSGYTAFPYSVEFTPEEERAIKEYKEKNQRAMPNDILDALFPEMPKKYRESKTSNTIYKIQLLIGTAYSGR